MPWTSHPAAPTLWTLPRERLRAEQPVPTTDLPAPYPALMTIGQDDEGAHVMVDLEQVEALAVDGQPEITEAVLTVIAVELGTSDWSDGLDLTLVGRCPELPAAMPDYPGRLRHVPDLE